MSRVKHYTSNALKEYLDDNFSGKKFCVHDLHEFANKREIPLKKLTYSCWWLCNIGFIVKCGERSKPEGGSPLNMYKLADHENETFKHVDMQTATSSLMAIFGYAHN